MLVSSGGVDGAAMLQHKQQFCFHIP